MKGIIIKNYIIFDINNVTEIKPLVWSGMGERIWQGEKTTV